MLWAPIMFMWAILPGIVIHTMIFDTPETFRPFPGWKELLLSFWFCLLGLTALLAWLCLMLLIFSGYKRLARSPRLERFFRRIIPAGLLVIVAYVAMALGGLNEGDIFGAPGMHAIFTLPIFFLIGLRYTVILAKRR